jgi:hypothetical protein
VVANRNWDWLRHGLWHGSGCKTTQQTNGRSGSDWGRSSAGMKA